MKAITSHGLNTCGVETSLCLPGGIFDGSPEYSGDTCFDGSVHWTHHPHLEGETLNILGDVTVSDCDGSFVSRSGKIKATGSINLNCGSTPIETIVEQCPD
jgi:hypothetical protein|tara:strand:+ start:986 stop:1288 length:303 start_codon:yes stop_codon:yes gene_type:complete